MIRGIDHLVIAVADPDAAAEELEAAVGIAATGGGRHPGAGTRNRLCFLADGSYLELIGVEDPDLARNHPIGAAALSVLESEHGGLATYALREDEIETAAATLGAIGSVGPVQHGTRTREDGDTVEWWTAIPTGGLGPERAPFLIEHAYTGSEWSADALAARAAFRHPLGSPVALVRLDIATEDPPATAAEIHEHLGVDFWSVADLAVADVGPHVIRLVPQRGMATRAVITLGADVESPLTADVLGVRFDVERAAVPARTTSDTG